MLRSVAGQLGAESVQEQYYRVADRLSGEFPQLGYLLDIACEEMVAYTCFTLAHWWKTRTTTRWRIRTRRSSFGDVS